MSAARKQVFLTFWDVCLTSPKRDGSYPGWTVRISFSAGSPLTIAKVVSKLMELLAEDFDAVSFSRSEMTVKILGTNGLAEPVGLRPFLEWIRQDTTST
jgi:hypothetical protein